MADWVSIPDTAVDPDAPVTSELAYAWRDNVVAVTEGAVGAPYEYAVWRPWDSAVWGDGGTGVIYDRTVDPSTVNTVDTPGFDDGWDYRFLIMALNIGAASIINLALEMGGAWSFPTAIKESPSSGGPAPVSGHVIVYNPGSSGVPRKSIEFSMEIDGTSSTAPQTNNSWGAGESVTIRRFLRNNADVITRARISWSGTAASAGRIILQKRRANGLIPRV